MQRVFLDIYRAFDKAWHKSLNYKLLRNGISDNLLKLLENFLCKTKQRIVFPQIVLT